MYPRDEVPKELRQWAANVVYLCFHLSKIRLEQSLAAHAFIKPLSAYIGKMELGEMHFSLPRGSHVLEGQRAISQPAQLRA